MGQPQERCVNRTKLVLKVWLGALTQLDWDSVNRTKLVLKDMGTEASLSRVIKASIEPSWY